MDLAELKQLVDQGESDCLEFKKTTGELKAGMQTLCAMFNGSGGMVVFGVTASGKVVGQNITDATLQEVAREIKKLEPSATIVQTMVPVAGSLRVLVLEATAVAGGPFVFDGRALQTDRANDFADVPDRVPGTVVGTHPGDPALGKSGRRGLLARRLGFGRDRPHGAGGAPLRTTGEPAV